MRRTESAIYLLLVAITCTGLGYLLASPEPEIITQVETVTVPEYIVVNNTRTIIETIEIPVTEIVTVNRTVTEKIYLPSGKNLIDYPNRAILDAWISTDNTDTIPYSARWTCMDYTLRVIHNAENAGFRVYFVYWDSRDHAVAMAYCVEENRYVAWEPQTDEVLWVWDSWPT